MAGSSQRTALVARPLGEGEHGCYCRSVCAGIDRFGSMPTDDLAKLACGSVERGLHHSPPRLAAVQKARAFTARSIYAAGLLARDERIPTPLRWLALLGLLPIPGPFDEAMLLMAAPLLFLFGREPLRDAWWRARRKVR